MQRHHFTVDVEEYFQVSAFEGAVDRASWDRIESRVQLPMLILLDMLAAHHARATFFFLGWVAERHPQLVRRVANAGHEIASHGWGHERVPTQRTASHLPRGFPAHSRTVARSSISWQFLQRAPSE